MPKLEKNLNIIPKVGLVKGNWYDCHFFYEKYKKTSPDFKKLMSWMKDVSFGEKKNYINGSVTKACVDIIIVDILYGMLVHSISKGHNIHSWMQLKAYEWWKTLFDFWNQCSQTMIAPLSCAMQRWQDSKKKS